MINGTKEKQTELFIKWAIKQLRETVDMGKVDTSKPFNFELKIKYNGKETNVTQTFSNTKRH